jgi:thiaminase
MRMNLAVENKRDLLHEGSLGEIMAVLLPCPWTYLEIGRRLMDEVRPDEYIPAGSLA